MEQDPEGRESRGGGDAQCFHTITRRRHDSPEKTRHLTQTRNRQPLPSLHVRPARIVRIFQRHSKQNRRHPGLNRAGQLSIAPVADVKAIRRLDVQPSAGNLVNPVIRLLQTHRAGEDRTLDQRCERGLGPDQRNVR